MCLRFVLCSVLSFNVPSFCFMGRPLFLCAFLLFYVPSSFYVPSFRSMFRSLIQCAFIPFYGPFSHSMCPPSVLWAVLSFYVPSFRSMDRPLSMCLQSVLWTVLPSYEPSPHSMALPPTLCSTLAYLQNILHLVATLSVVFSIIEVKGEHGRYWEDEQIIV